MNNIPSQKELSDLYNNKNLSLSEISSNLHISIHKVRYWMDKYGIKRRKQSEANYIKANPHGEPFKIKKRLTRNETKLKYLALGIYWGEGNKITKQGVRVTNSDHGVKKQFYKYLNVICQVKNDKIKFYLQTFKDNKVALAKQYWSNQLQVSSFRIKTSTPIPSQGNGTYKNISKFGVITIAVFNIHLKRYIMNELGKLGLIR